MTAIHLTTLLTALIIASCSAISKLTFSAEGAFKILMFADLHYGEGENTTWGPMQDVMSTLVMDSVLSSEITAGVTSDAVVAGDGSLVIFSGDQITGNNVETNATAYLQMLFGPVNRTGIAFATIYGNHDDAPCCSEYNRPQGLDTRTNGSTVSPKLIGSVTTRQQLQQFERETYPQSFSLPGPASLHGVSNYVLPLYSHDATRVLAFLYMLDSGGGSYPEIVYPDQIAWLNATRANLTAAYGPLPSLTFVHIPVVEYQNAYVPLGPGSPCSGVLADDGITPTLNNSGLFALLSSFEENAAVFVGHDHGNAWCCMYRGMQLCYGRHTGYGGYGDWDRGSRVVQLQLDAIGSQVVNISSWVRMENGTANSGEDLWAHAHA